jgi:tetratricopeptide (TPR) repeat protein
MVMRILWDNQWKKPVYYAVTVSSDNMIGLTPYFRMDGLAFKILPYRAGNEIDGKVLEDNLLKKYKYRNLNNPKVYNDINILKLLQNYRSAFMQLAQYFEDNGRNPDAIRVLDEMNSVMPQEVIPYSDERAALYINNLYLRAGKKIDLSEQLKNVIPGQPQNAQEMLWTASYYAQNLQDWDSAERILRRLIQADRNNGQAYSELLRVFSLSRQHEKAAALLEEYILYHPEDTSASNELTRIRAAIAAAPKPAGTGPEFAAPEAGKPKTK